MKSVELRGPCKMFLALFVASFFLALAISLTLVWLFKKPIEDFLHRFIGDPMICTAWSKYIRFAIVAVGISTGTRVGAFQDYLSAPAWNKPELAAQLTQDFWALELYRTVAGTLIGLAWLLLAFCVMRGSPKSSSSLFTQSKCEFSMSRHGFRIPRAAPPAGGKSQSIGW